MQVFFLNAPRAVGGRSRGVARGGLPTDWRDTARTSNKQDFKSKHMTVYEAGLASRTASGYGYRSIGFERYRVQTLTAPHGIGYAVGYRRNHGIIHAPEPFDEITPPRILLDGLSGIVGVTVAWIRLQVL